MPHLPTGTVTLLFTDIEGTTLLLQQRGSDYSSVLTTCHHLVRAALQQCNGHEVDTQGDAFFGAFARATDAVAAAVIIQRSFSSHPWPQDGHVRVRIGIHTGEPQLTTEGYVGLDVHQAARLMHAGHGGQVLLSQTTHDLVVQNLPDGVTLRAMGAHRLKDIQRPIHLFQLVIPGLPADFPALKTLDAYPNNLPIPPTTLIGREREVATLRALLSHDEVRLLTLTGPGGTGKTRLGLQVVADQHEQFPDGVFFVNLAPIRDPELVIATIAKGLNLKESGTQPLSDLLTAFLRDKHLLLLLDNFEQVLGAAPHVAHLLSLCSRLKIVVTSRAVLHLQGEQEFSVPPLTVPDPKHLPDLLGFSQYEALTLFIQRAQAVKHDFQVSNATAAAVAEICVRLDGLPLAIELAAARSKLLPPQALLARLGQRLAILTSGAQDVPTRQQTLRNTIVWSYDLLDVAEQCLFRRLSIFAGGCTFEAIEALCAALDEDREAGFVLDRVASLLDKSLLKQHEREGEKPRFWMLETLREFALEALEISGEMERTRQAHATYYIALAEQWRPQLGNVPQIAWLELLEREHENIRATMQWSLDQGEEGDPLTTAWRLGDALLPFWNIHSHPCEGRMFLEHVLTKQEGVSINRRARILHAAGYYAFVEGERDRAEVLAEESLSLYKQMGDRGGIADALTLIGLLTWDTNTVAATRVLKEEVLALYREINDKTGIAETLHQLGWLARDQGEYAHGYSLLEESLMLSKEIGEKELMADALIQMAHLLFDSQGDQVVMHSLLEESLLLFQEVGNKSGIAMYYHLAGRVTLNKGDMITARSLLEESLRLHRELGIQGGFSWSLSALARVETGLMNYLSSRTLHEECMVRAKRLKDRELMTFCLEGFAAVMASQEEPVWAARLWGVAETLRSAIGIPLPPVERASYVSFVTTARDQLGEQAFSTAWAEGRTMTPEQALATQGRAMNALPSSMVVTLPARVTSPIVHPDGLTSREVEVLRLLATGLTNVQLAEHLVISPRTVDSHLTSIYSKIGVSSRSAATRYALDHHLV